MDAPTVTNGLLTLVAGFLTIVVGFLTWITTRYQYRYNTLDRYLKNHTMITEAISLAIQEGYISNKTLSLLWRAHDDARLILDSKLADFVEKLFMDAKKSYDAHLEISFIDSNPAILSAEDKQKRNDLAKVKTSFLMKFTNSREIVYKEYQPFTKIHIF